MTPLRPLNPSAPLSDDASISWLPPNIVRAEAIRAQRELLHAIRKHRAAWSLMAKLKKQADERGVSWYMDNDRDWKLATGDVTWWRGEMSARSNSLLALLQLAALYGINIAPEWHDTTTLGEQPGSSYIQGRDSVPVFEQTGGEPRPSEHMVREIVYSWGGSGPTTERQRAAARAWLDVGPGWAMCPGDRDYCTALLAAPHREMGE